MSIWDDVGEQTGIWTGYAGLSPEEALQKWYRTQQQMKDAGIPPGQPGPGGEVLGSMETLAQQNPAAFRMVATGRNQQGGTREIFNPQTGQWDKQDVKSWWSHPESWGQLALGGLFAASAPAAIAGSAGEGATAAGSAAPAATAAPASSSLGLGAVEGGAYGFPASSAAMVPGAVAAPSAAGIGASAAAPSVAASTVPAAAGGGGSSALRAALPYIIGGATDIAGGLIGSRAAQTAAGQQQRAAQQAISGVLQPIYQEQRGYLAPYAQLGYGAIGNLAGLSNIQRPSPAPYPFSPYSSTNVPMSSLGQPYANPYAQQAMATLKAPDGSTKQVPESQAAHYIQMGATRVG